MAVINDRNLLKVHYIVFPVTTSTLVWFLPKSLFFWDFQSNPSDEQQYFRTGIRLELYNRWCLPAWPTDCGAHFWFFPFLSESLRDFAGGYLHGWKSYRADLDYTLVCFVRLYPFFYPNFLDRGLCRKREKFLTRIESSWSAQSKNYHVPILKR